jgi:Na+-transporting NADH:ubiquinone oxidoreductase subunit NqrC
MNKLIRGCNFVMMLALIAGLAIGCAKKPDKSQIVADINNYQVTVDDFNREMSMSIPDTGREQVLQDIIIKELILQEAQKMEMDKDKGFMKEIENYWKQTLIKRLIDKKGREFMAASDVSDEEAKAEYKFMRQEEGPGIGSYEKIKDEVRRTVMRKKAQVELDKWITGLRNSARIVTHESVLKGVGHE